MLHQTPDGIVDIKFWEAVVQADNPKSHTLKICPKLKMDHIHPKFYQKMNVAMAFQFFSHSVACAMEFLKETNPELKDCSGCISFIKRIDKLITAMNSRTPKDAAKINSPAIEAIQTFLPYLNEWENLAKRNSFNFMSESTVQGLKITLKGALEIFAFLTNKCNFQYLMTSRLSQDALERFFSMMRSACGCNDHPDATTFLQVFRLLGTYSLVKPPRGCNVSGSELLTTLLSTEDIEDSTNIRQEFGDKIDALLMNESDDHAYNPTNDHSYFLQSTSVAVVGFVAGFVAFRGKNATKCLTCRNSLIVQDNKENEEPGAYKLINFKSLGHLSKPSASLFKLIMIIEEACMKVLSRQKLHIDSVSDVLNELEQFSTIPLVGCLAHQQAFTRTLLQYYIIIRMIFICKRENNIDDFKSNKTRELKKLSRL